MRASFQGSQHVAIMGSRPTAMMIRSVLGSRDLENTASFALPVVVLRTSDRSLHHVCNFSCVPYRVLCYRVDCRVSGVAPKPRPKGHFHEIDSNGMVKADEAVWR